MQYLKQSTRHIRARLNVERTSCQMQNKKSLSTSIRASEPSRPPSSKVQDQLATILDTTIDVVNLFTHLGAENAAFTYHEVRSDADAKVAAARWPLLAEWQASDRQMEYFS